MLGIKVHVRRTCLPARLPSGLPVCSPGCPAACRPSRLPVSLSGYLSACPATGLSACPPACESARLPVGLPSCLSACPATCQPAQVPVSLPGYLSVCPATSQPARLPVSLPGYLSACPAACQPARLPVSLPGYQSACLATFLSSCAYPETYKETETQHDWLPSVLGEEDKWSEIVYERKQNRVAKAGQKSLVPARRAQRTNQRRTPFVCRYSLSTPVCLGFNSQQRPPLSSLCVFICHSELILH